MNHTEIRVVTGPANYFSHAGSLERLTDFFTPEQLSHAVWVYGERAIAAARPYLPEAFERAGAKHLPFTGHCSERHVAQLAHACNDDRQVVIASAAARCSIPPKRSPAVWRCRLSLSRQSRQPAPPGHRFPSGITTRDRRYSSKFLMMPIFWCWSNRALFCRRPMTIC